MDVLTAIKRRYPGVNFVWLMGADNLADIHRWRAWQTIFGLMPIAVLDRPGYRLRARASQGAQRFADFHVDESDARGLAQLEPPAWTVVTHPLSGLSSTAIRAKTETKPKRKKPKAKARANQAKATRTPEQKAKAKAAAAKRDKAAKRAKKAAAKASAKVGKKPTIKKAARKAPPKKNRGKKKPKRR